MNLYTKYVPKASHVQKFIQCVPVYIRIVSVVVNWRAEKEEQLESTTQTQPMDRRTERRNIQIVTDQIINLSWVNLTTREEANALKTCMHCVNVYLNLCTFKHVHLNTVLTGV